MTIDWTEMTTATATTPETVTLDELEDALQVMVIHVGGICGGSRFQGRATYPDSLVHDLHEYIVKHREPAYEPGQLYQSALGFYYLRRSEGTWTDVTCGRVVKHEYPSRPLTQMVPEQPE